MSSNQNRFEISAEHLEGDQHDPPESLLLTDEPQEGEIEVLESPDRRQSLRIAGQGALAGGLLVGVVATVLMLSTSSGSTPSAEAQPTHRASSAVVVGAAPPAAPADAVADEAPADEPPASDEAPAEKAQLDEAAPDEAASDKAQSDKAPADEAAPDEAQPDEAEADEAPPAADQRPDKAREPHKARAPRIKKPPTTRNDQGSK